MPRTTKHLKKHQFKKGEPSANPLGGKLANPITRALSNLTIETYREVIQLVLTGTMDDLQALAQDPKTPAVQVGVARSFHKAIKNGDYDVIEKIAQRIIGKIPDVIQIDSKNINANLNTGIDYVKLKAALSKLESDV